ncbi:NAD(P)-binding domain protein [Cordyceps fumosorosea ARSEF 2679]|uniref:NAD(P)-binding domain protein n=1 Tax=Cordyceps fumosorosea (strain ARSEF 2679) TaxID=1081104 RepID=A0A168AJ18_CORFA|nr:NAD(P)-binding domain protein [Cordyceps fumosorosea ARSEF 2679]OAA68816.1 NAD(P)-binding domain protein [Cordyceps fumosorosea ARSEF 2679]
MSSQEKQVWLITGASSGFGLQLALRALAAGQHVIGTVRSSAGPSASAVHQLTSAGGHVLELDMTHPQAAIHEVVALQYRTNVYGPLFTTQAVLPGMRARRRGCVVNVSSAAGQDAGAARGLYGGSKFALEGLTEALRAEVAEFGVAVLLVEPGLFRTNFFRALRTPAAPLPEAYRDGSAVSGALDAFAALADGTGGGDPSKAADRIYEVVAGEGLAGHLRGKVLRLPLGMDAVERVEAKQRSVLAEVAEARKLEEQQSTALAS